jgi:ubiquitin-protein ligase
MSKAFRTERLLRDVQFLQSNPIEGAAVEPKGADLTEWHGNVTLEGSNFHFIVTFPPQYPTTAPTVRMSTLLPHPNVQPNGVVCCDALGNNRSNHEEIVGGAWAGWCVTLASSSSQS